MRYPTNSPHLLEGGICIFKGVEANIDVNESAEAVSCKARPVSHFMHPQVEAELDHLWKEGVISPIEFSDWACPIVPAFKSDGSLRIFRDL